jgi:hypothetical protein
MGKGRDRYQEKHGRSERPVPEGADPEVVRQLRDVATRQLEHSRGLIEGTGELAMPMLSVLMRDGTAQALFYVLGPDPEQRRETFRGLREKALEMGAAGVVAVQDTWRSKEVTAEKLARYREIRRMPDRMDCLVVWMHAPGYSETWSQEYRKAPAGGILWDRVERAIASHEMTAGSEPLNPWSLRNQHRDALSPRKGDGVTLDITEAVRGRGPLPEGLAPLIEASVNWKPGDAPPDRPEDVTERDVAEWGAEWEEMRAENPIQSGAPREMHYAGRWLERRLLEMGVPEGEREDALFANGQKQAARSDAWGPSRETLEEVRRGAPPRPGRELGERLLSEQLAVGGMFGLFDSFIARGLSPEALDRMLDSMRAEPRYPHEPHEGRHAPLFAEMEALKAPEEAITRMLELYRLRWESHRSPAPEEPEDAGR